MTNSDHPPKEFRDSLRWILAESGQMLTIESSGTDYIRSLEGGQWCVGSNSDCKDKIILDEIIFTNVEQAIDEYITRVTNHNNW